jgi:excisionase family DNA binding protein
MTQNNNFFTIPQAAERCSISRVTLWRWVKSGKLKAYATPGGHYKIRKNDLETFIRGNMRHLRVSDAFPKKKIMIVDDDHEMRKLLTKILSKNGYLTETASNGIDAGIKIMQFKPDLIILDFNMPQMDSFDVCMRIKKESDHSQIKILILTAYDTVENRDRIMKAGADAFLAKPIKNKVLLQHVEYLLSGDKKQTLSSNKEVMYQ